MINKIVPLFGKRRGGGVVPENRLILQVKTDNAGTSGTNQFTIPTNPTGITIPFNYDIETSDGYVATGITGSHTITFPSGIGTHLIYISGSLPFIYFNNVGDKLKLLDIQNFGIYGLGSTNQQNAFRGCSNMNITATDSGHFGDVTLFSQTWLACSSIVNFPLIDTSSCLNFFRAWRDCTSLISFPLIDTSSATSFQEFIYGCTSLTSFPLLDTSSGTNFNASWRNCLTLSNFPQNAFDLNIASDYTNVFLNTSLNQLSIDGVLVSLDTSGVSSGIFTQSGGSAPSSVGQAAITSLRSKGWTITVTGGF